MKQNRFLRFLRFLLQNQKVKRKSSNCKTPPMNIGGVLLLENYFDKMFLLVMRL